MKTPENVRHAGARKYIVHWAWKMEDTDEGIKKYKYMKEMKKKEDPKLAELLSAIEDHLQTVNIAEKKYPTSLGSSDDDVRDGFTIFYATDDQLENWFNHYKEVLQVKEIKPITSADDFVEKWEDTKKVKKGKMTKTEYIEKWDEDIITWRYWYER